jgi:glutamate-ammonia-ligase adenylyltransferase
VVVLGLGGLAEALTHASDLDLIYLFDAPQGAQSNGKKPLPATDYYNRWQAASVLRSARRLQPAPLRC